MSTHQVRVRRVHEVLNHPNADRLEICKVDGYQCVVRKGSYRKGQLVVYIPEQSVIPDYLLRDMGFWEYKDEAAASLDGKGTLSGKEGNVVNICRLRGEISQGLLMEAEPGWKLDQDVTELLSITKYEAPIPAELLGSVKQGPLQIKFDIENIQAFPEVLEPGEPVHISIKLHGTCCFILFNRDGSHWISSKGLVCKGQYLIGDSVYHRATANYISSMASLVDTEYEYTLFIGEIYGRGVQDLHYGVDKPTFALFDIAQYKNSLWNFVPRSITFRTAEHRHIPSAPVLYEGPWSPSLIDDYVIGKRSSMGSHVEEGAVICSSSNRKDPSIGRVILKSINPDYLFRKGGTEYQ